MFTWTQLQEEQKPWQEHNFGNRPVHMPLLGIVEEFGELLEADTPEEDLDACADVMIFMSDYCNARGWKLQGLVDVAMIYHRELIEFDPQMCSIALGKACHAHLKQEQRIRTSEDHTLVGKEALSIFISHVNRVASNHGFDLIDIVEKTWAKVKLRDWKKDSATAGEVTK